jgi:RNA methyltransferase, TrmH family
MSASDLIPPLTRAQRQHLRQLRRRAYREECGEVLLEGARLVADALDGNAPLRLCVVEDGRVEQHAALLQRMREAAVPIQRVSARDAALLADTGQTQGVFAVAAWSPRPMEECLARDGASGMVVALHGANDPGNAGTILRNCDWFGAGALLLSAGSVDAGNAKTVRASMGSLFRVPVGYYDDAPALLAEARARGYTIVATSGNGGVAPDAAARPARLLLLFGSEAHGLPAELLAEADLTYRIPGRGGAESLNLAVAHGILLHALCRMREDS